MEACRLARENRYALLSKRCEASLLLSFKFLDYAFLFSEKYRVRNPPSNAPLLHNELISQTTEEQVPNNT
jgi:hypothetical protein